MSAAKSAAYRRASVNGSLAYDLSDPVLYPEYQYDLPLDIPAPPRIDEEVVADTAAIPSQSFSPVAALGYLIVAVLLVCSLLTRVQLTKLSDECVSLSNSLAVLEDSNQKLRIAYEGAFNLAEIEEYAVNNLGMQRPRSDQVYYISGSVQDMAVVLGGAGEDVGFADRVGDFISSFAVYFQKDGQ